MAEVLREYCDNVRATDIHDYGYGDGVLDFLASAECADWIVRRVRNKTARGGR